MSAVLDEILHYFPRVELPILLSDDHLSEYESSNDQLPQSFIEKYIYDWEKETEDDMSEYIPVGSLPPTEKFYPIIYWKAGLLRYDFILVTLSKLGDVISRKSIASTIVHGQTIKKYIASIDPDYIITIVAGHSEGGEDYDAEQSQSYSMEILPTGEIFSPE
jgi:hypothetical protein